MGVTIGVGAAAVNTGNNLLYLLLGLLLSLVLANGVLSDLALRRVRLRRRLPQRLFVGRTALVEIGLRNDKRRLPSYALEVRDPTLADIATARCHSLKIAPASDRAVACPVVPVRRGPLRLEALELGTRYPFGLVEKWQPYDLPAEAIVYPALAPSETLDGSLQQEGPDAPHDAIGRGIEVASLRDYRDGDEARDIHWLRSASVGEIVVRERERDTTRTVSLLLDNRVTEPDDAPSRAAFEQTVSRTATLVARSLASGITVEVLTRGDRSPLVAGGSDPDPLWRFLALVDRVPADVAGPFPEARGEPYPLVSVGAPNAAARDAGARGLGAEPLKPRRGLRAKRSRTAQAGPTSEARR
ncbi:MAG: DUF58 domain-containing protein [Myxococcales bacterium]|nr:DUF58 domain-containing protein [Myxococcales bacterium]